MGRDKPVRNCRAGLANRACDADESFAQRSHVQARCELCATLQRATPHRNLAAGQRTVARHACSGQRARAQQSQRGAANRPTGGRARRRAEAAPLPHGPPPPPGGSRGGGVSHCHGRVRACEVTKNPPRDNAQAGWRGVLDAGRFAPRRQWRIASIGSGTRYTRPCHSRPRSTHSPLSAATAGRHLTIPWERTGWM